MLRLWEKVSFKRILAFHIAFTPPIPRWHKPGVPGFVGRTQLPGLPSVTATSDFFPLLGYEDGLNGSVFPSGSSARVLLLTNSRSGKRTTGRVSRSDQQREARGRRSAR